MGEEKGLGRLRLLYVLSTDVFHTVLGMFTVYLAKHFGHVFPFNLIASLGVMAVFFAYQLQDDDTPEERLGDLIEYTVGLVVGQAL